MKYLSFLILIMSLMSCKKDDSVKLADQLIGKWELVSSSGGIAGITINYSAGSGNTVEFNGSSYKEIRDNKLTRAGAYTTKKQMSMLLQEEGDGLVYEGNEQRYFFSISGSELSIYHDANDGFNNRYQRIN
jgi:outer membrane protein assembly factor BamB